MRILTTALVALLSAGLAACDVDVRESEGRGKGNVDIRTPVGALSVRTDRQVNETGLPVYPGARWFEEVGGGHGSVHINTSLFGLEVQAAKYDTDEAPSAVLGFYRDEMRAFGDYVECRGNVDFTGRSSRPVCRNGQNQDEILLVSGTEDTHRMVVVKPRGRGAEFSLVYIDTRVGG